MLKIKSTAETLNHISERMAAGEPYYFSRFGDADLAIMCGGMGQDQIHDPKLAVELREAFAFKDPRYDKALALEHAMEPGMCKGLFEPVRRESQRFQNLVASLTEQTEYQNAVVFHYQSVFHSERVRVWLDRYIRPKRKLYIGCHKPATVEPLIGKVDRWVYTAPKNCYSTMDWWWNQILLALSKDIELVIAACGVPTRVVNHKLMQRKYPVQSIDIGSVIDAVAGETTRTWIRLAGTNWLKVLTEGGNVASI